MKSKPILKQDKQPKTKVNRVFTYDSEGNKQPLDSMLYTLSATAKKLGVYPSEIKEIREFANVIWVHIKGRRPTFISKKYYKKNFVLVRQQRAVDLGVTGEFLNRVQVTNPDRGSQYSVTVTSAAVICTCPDYEKQVEQFGKGVCKHGYKALYQLGYNSLEDLIQADKQARASRAEFYEKHPELVA